MSLCDHTMQNREEKEISPFRLACKFSKEIAERINNMSPMELRKKIQNAGTEKRYDVSEFFIKFPRGLPIEMKGVAV